MSGWKQRALECLKAVLREDFGDRAPRRVYVTWRKHRGDFRVGDRSYIVAHDWRHDKFRVGDTPRRAGLRVTYFKSQCETMIPL